MLRNAWLLNVELIVIEYNLVELAVDYALAPVNTVQTKSSTGSKRTSGSGISCAADEGMNGAVAARALPALLIDFRHLASDPHNAHILAMIHSSAIVLCLDTESAPTFEEDSRFLWQDAVVPSPQAGIPHAQPQLGLQNRWMDRPYRFIVLADGKDFAPSTFSPMDSTPADVALLEPLDRNVTQETQCAIDAPAEAAVALISSQTLNVMARQLAYAWLLQKKGRRRQGGTYHAAAMRKFFNGRTKAICVVSAGSDSWVATRRGLDRHLLVDEGGRAAARGVLAPAREALELTSAIYTKNFGPYGWGEVVPDHFEVAYVAGVNDFLQFTVTPRTEMPNAEFCEELQRAAGDMYDLFARQSERQGQGVGKTKL
ncbi:hypothetical protein C8Q74DRAFT_1365976 [Fomes fomentarius]|nr:hypothetical protein C8Q74DRAFT_1365976 [Fomes fomentarius]